MRVVFDTNVIVSGFLWRGSPRTLCGFIREQRMRLCLTPAIIEEIRRVLTYPKLAKKLELENITHQEFLKEVLNGSMLFPDTQFVAPIRKDPTDNIFLNCAIVSDAKWIVSGDRHLLELGEFANIRIVTPAHFLRIVQKMRETRHLE